MYHFYSVTGREAGVDNEMGTVTVFLQVYDDAPPYRFLDKIICEWRRHENNVRQECGLDPIEQNYPGCFPNTRRRNLRTESRRRQVQRQQFQTIHDVIIHNTRHKNNPNVTKPTIILEDVNFEPMDPKKDWDAWIQNESDKLRAQDAAYRAKQKAANMTHPDEDTDEYRRLIQGDEIDWYNYFLMLGVRTEYYFRYSGVSLTCFVSGLTFFGLIMLC